MPRKKKEKEPIEMTSEELAKKVFPPQVLKQLKKIANPDEQSKKPSPSEDK